MGPKLLQKVFEIIYFTFSFAYCLHYTVLFLFRLQRISNLHHKLLVNRIRAADAKQHEAQGKVNRNIFDLATNAMF